MIEYKRLAKNYKDYRYMGGAIQNDIAVTLRIGCGVSFSAGCALIGYQPSHISSIASRYREYHLGLTKAKEMLQIINKEDTFTLNEKLLGTDEFLKECKKISLYVTGATEEEFESRKRHRHIVKARQLFWYVVRLYGMPSRVIEDYCPRDSSAARAFYRKMQWEMQAVDFKDEVEMFMNYINKFNYERN